jgi:hypothetical protein
MSWLKRLEPIVIEQASTLPYVILEDGVRLGFHNLFMEKADKTDHFIRFKVNRNELSRKSTNYWRLAQFPVVVPFENVLELDDCIIEGKVIKQAHVSESSEPKNISITLSGYFHEMDDHCFQEFVEEIDDYDHNFILAGEDLDAEVRLLADDATIIPHTNWNMTAVSVADSVSESAARKYCWTRSLPELVIYGRGFESNDDMENFTRSLEWIGVTDYSCTWGD